MRHTATISGDNGLFCSECYHLCHYRLTIFIIASQSCELIDSLSCKTGLSDAYESSKCLTKLQPLRQHLSFQISFSFYTINKATGKTMGVTLNTYWGTQNKPDLCVAWRPDQEALAALLVSRSKIKVGKIMLLYKEWLFFFIPKPNSHLGAECQLEVTEHLVEISISSPRLSIFYLP